MLNLSLNELKLVAKSRCIKGYKNMSKEKLLVVLSGPRLVGSERNFDNARIKNIREDLNELKHKFSKSEIKEMKKNLYDIKNQKNVSKSKMIEIEENLPVLEETTTKCKKCHDYDDFEYRGIRDIGNLFNQSTNEYCYKQTETTDNFDNKNSYIEYESKGDKDKNLLPKEYLDMIKSCLSIMINNYKAHGKLKVCSGNRVIDYETVLWWR